MEFQNLVSSFFTKYFIKYGETWIKSWTEISKTKEEAAGRMTIGMRQEKTNVDSVLSFLQI